MPYNTNETRLVARIRIPIRTSNGINLNESAPLPGFGIPGLFLKAATIQSQFIAIWSPPKSTTKFKGTLCIERHDRSLIVFIPRFGSTTCEIIVPETNSVIINMNKVVLRKKLNLVRRLTVLKNFLVTFWIHGQAIIRCIIIGIKKMNPNTSCTANPVILGERSKIRMTRRAVSKQITNLLRGEAIISMAYAVVGVPF